MCIPSAVQATEHLRALRVEPEDLAAVLDARSLIEHHSVERLVLDHVAKLRAAIGVPGPLPPWPDLLPHFGRAGRLVYPWVFVTALPHALAYQRARGIDAAVALPSLANLAHQLRRHRLLFGYAGLHEQDWLTRHFRGLIHVLGRLHFERATWLGTSAAGAGGPELGEPVLDLHIPSGALTPEACDAALSNAVSFFATHFPEERYRFATCSSWVLDPQLREYLDPASNIVRFQSRFSLAPEPGPDRTRTLVDFVFDRADADLDALPTATSLQRGIVAHARSGRPWHFRRGWFPLPESPRQTLPSDSAPTPTLPITRER